jgi:hypothetical protein
MMYGIYGIVRKSLPINRLSLQPHHEKELSIRGLFSSPVHLIHLTNPGSDELR